ncbi:MAG: TolC family protein [Deltaproteobacteria bacterium]|nr:TolC family protein [Deltaproteobacteria bacterium]
MRLKLNDYVRLVVENNENILAQHHEYIISRENIRREQSVFEPEFVSSYQHGHDKKKLSQEDKRSQNPFGTIYESDKTTKDLNAVIQSNIPTGGNVKLGYTQNASKNWVYNEAMDYTSFLGIDITQPLLKNTGSVSSSKIRAAEKDSDVTFQTYRMKMIEVVFNALSTCWDYYGYREKLKIRHGSVEIAEKILEENRARIVLGKMADTEGLEAEAALAKRKSWESAAQQELISAMNNMRSFTSSADVDIELDIDFSEEITINDLSPDFDSSIQRAIESRPEYQSVLQRIEKEKILVSYAQNQRWPQLDLIGSYGLNGLGSSSSDSFGDAIEHDYSTWKVGLSLTIPLGGGQKSRSELETAKRRKQQALLELKSVEVQIANIIDTAIANVYSTRDQLSYNKKAKEIEGALLEVELERLNSGKSTSRVVLEKEEDLNYAREAELESFVNNRKAILALAVAEGSLLLDNGVEIKKNNLETVKEIDQ